MLYLLQSAEKGTLMTCANNLAMNTANTINNFSLIYSLPSQYTCKILVSLCIYARYVYVQMIVLIVQTDIRVYECGKVLLYPLKPTTSLCQEYLS